MDALSRRDAASVSEQGRAAGSGRRPPDSSGKPANLGAVVRKMAKGDRVAIRLGDRRLGYVELKGPTSDGARIVFCLDREVIIERD